MHEDMEKYRFFLKDTLRSKMDFSLTDQSRGVNMPPAEKPFPAESMLVSLPGPDEWQNIKDLNLVSAIRERKSRRNFLDEPLELDELSFLLWATQGIRKRIGSVTLRIVPSAGNRHAIETYICVLNVLDLEPGIYRFLPLEHALLPESGSISRTALAEKIGISTLGQFFIGTAAAVFVWTAIPYRMEWRYGIAAHKVIAIDSGHICQNLYLACEAISAGTCAIAAYNQELMDELISVDSREEFTIYLAPVGKV